VASGARPDERGGRRRRILLITTDQQRADTLGCYGGTLARTPVVDSLAATGIRYDRAHPQSVVCMPSRSTILTGQHPSTHGVWMNGVPLPADAPSVAEVLRRAGFRTALVGKAHFEPFLDPERRFPENALARTGTTPDGGHHRGFEHLELASHVPVGPLHYARWMAEQHPEAIGGFYRVLDEHLQVNAAGGGDTGAPQVSVNPVPREWYHTDWVADRTIAWIEDRSADEDWFCWMSFPDPHHPWDPPQAEVGRIDWRQVPLPAGYPADAEERRRLLDAKPVHWRRWYEGALVASFEAPPAWVPATLTADQLREVLARNAVECELIDEAVGRVLAAVAAKGWDDDLDVLFTTDHGDLGGDFGLLFKGPYHVDGLLRLPLVWRPAPSAGALVPGTVVTRPVGLVDLAPTLCTIAGLAVPPWMEGRPLPVGDDEADRRGAGRVLTEWDSDLLGVEVHLRTMVHAGWLVTAYQPGTVHDGTEGELYDLVDDPLQRANRWDDPACRAVRQELLADLNEQAAPARRPRRRPVAPV